MARRGKKWGNALGGYKTQSRSANGQFGSGGTKKKSKRKTTTISRANGTTYRTVKTKGLIPGRSTLETTAYHRGEFKGTLTGYQSKKGTKIDFLYVAPAHRGTGVSKGLASRQLHHARRNGGVVEITGQRSDGGEKFVQRNIKAGSAGIAVKSRDRSMSTAEITEVMDAIGQSKAQHHAKKYRKTQLKNAKRARAAKNPRKGMSTQKKAAIAAGIVVAAGATAYAVENRRIGKEYAEMGGPAGNIVNHANGISFTTVSARRRGSFSMDQGAMMQAMSGRNRDFIMHAPRIGRVSLLPQIDSVTYIHKGDQVLGYTTQNIRGRRLRANDLYLEPGSRGNRQVVSSLSKNMKDIQGEQVSRGRKIIISKYRSADSERIVRNQARRLGAQNVIVQKRFDPGSDFTANITSSMDSWFRNEISNDFDVINAIKGKKVRN